MKSFLFYDGACGLCGHEMRLLNKYKDNNLILLDVHKTDLSNYDVDAYDLLRLLHYLGKDGSWLTGLDATVAAWRHTPFGLFIRPLRWPMIKQIADFFYHRWASRRACRLGY